RTGSPSIFVTLGTIQGYRFDSLIEAVLNSGLANEETVWQLGDTPVDNLTGTSHITVSEEAFMRYALEADVVVSHAGVVTLLILLDAGIRPILVVRRRERGEYVDNHQAQIAHLAKHKNIASVHEATQLTEEHIRNAAGWKVRIAYGT